MQTKTPKTGYTHTLSMRTITEEVLSLALHNLEEYLLNTEIY